MNDKDMRVGGLALATTAVTIVDILAPTPEDFLPVLGWVDEITLLGLTGKFWMEYFGGRTMEDLARDFGFGAQGQGQG